MFDKSTILEVRNMKKYSVLHAPVEISGQMAEYVLGLREFGIEATAVQYTRHPFGYYCDKVLDLDKLQDIKEIIARQLEFTAEAIRKYDIIHMHFGQTLINYGIDLPLLVSCEKNILMNFWGSDVRIIRIAKMYNPYIELVGYHESQDERVYKTLAFLSQYIKQVIVPDIELYNYVQPFFQNVHIIRQAVNCKKIEPRYPDTDNKKPLIVHSPSNRNTKGTRFILNAVEELKKSFNFDFMLIENLPNEKVKELYEKADIVVDQVLLGSYGIAALESMARGKPVICYITQYMKEWYPRDLPIVNANVENLVDVLAELIKNPRMRTEIGMQGRKYVEKYHDRTVVAEKLSKLYDKLMDA